MNATPAFAICLLLNVEGRGLTFSKFSLYKVLCAIWSILNSRFTMVTDIRSDSFKSFAM